VQRCNAITVIAVQYCVDQIGLAITQSGLDKTAAEFKANEDEHKKALIEAGLKLIQARQVMAAVVKAAESATAPAPTPVSAKRGSSKGGSSKGVTITGGSRGQQQGEGRQACLNRVGGIA